MFESMNKINLGPLRAANIARQAEWPGGGAVDLAFRGLELAGEVGEAIEARDNLIKLAIAAGNVANKLKKVVRVDRGIAGTHEKIAELKEALAHELADIIVSADLVAMDLDIDLSKAVPVKFNMTSLKNGLRTQMRE